MKKITKLLFTLFIPAIGIAQPTITSADFPTIGSMWVEFDDNSTGSQTVTAPGPSQTWNYSYTVTDTSIQYFESPTVTPPDYQAAYPSAQMVNYDPNETSAIFYKSDNTGFYLDGYYIINSGTVLNSDFNPDQLMVPTPFTYNDTRTDASKMVMILAFPPSTFYKVVSTVTKEFEADAYGSLTTPAGTFTDVLRIKTYTKQVDSSYMDVGSGYMYNDHELDSNTVYLFMQNGTDAIVATVEVDPANPATVVSASYFDNDSPVGVKSIDKTAKTNVYPNPAASAMINFTLPENAANMKVYDVLGKQVINENVIGITQMQLHSSMFISGLYVYSIADKSGKIISTGKFSVKN